MIDIKELSLLAKKAEASSKHLFRKHKKIVEKLDDHVAVLHEKYTAQYDCLACGNCCRSLGPFLTDRDIDKIAKALHLKPSAVVEKYIRIDEDGDYVFKIMPCPFLMPDNYCQIYENRPKACKEYPHTDRKKFYQITNLSIKNSHVCPIVYEVLEDLKKELK